MAIRYGHPKSAKIAIFLGLRGWCKVAQVDLPVQARVVRLYSRITSAGTFLTIHLCHVAQVEKEWRQGGQGGQVVWPAVYEINFPFPVIGRHDLAAQAGVSREWLWVNLRSE